MSKTSATVFLSVARVGNLLLQLIAVRLFTDWLGKDHYGEFLWIQATVGYLMVFDIGLWIGIQKRLTEAVARGDQDTADRVVRLLFISTWITGSVSVLTFVLFGAIFRYLGSSGQSPPSMELFIYAAFGYLGTFYYASCQFVLASTERFGKIAKLNLLQSVLSTGTAIGLAYIRRAPESIALGTAIGGCLTAVVARSIVKPSKIPIKGHARELLRDLVPIGIRGYPHRLASLIGRSADRVIVGGVSRVQLTNYRFGCQLPEVLSDIAAPLTQTTLPELTRAHQEPAEFSRLVARNGLIALGVGGSFILMPSAFGHCALHVWLGRDMADLDTVMFCMGIYRLFELLYASLATPFYATGQVQRLIVFSTFNAVVTAVGTYFAFRYEGLVGVGVMNVCIGLAQFFPLLWVVRRLAGPTFHLGGFILRSSAIIVSSTVAAALVHWFLDRQLLAGHELWAFLLGPIVCLGWIGILCGTGLCPTPDPVLRRLRRQ